MADKFIEVPSNLEDTTILKRFINELVDKLNGNALVSYPISYPSGYTGPVPYSYSALVGQYTNTILEAAERADTISSDAKNYITGNLTTNVLQNTEDLATITEQFGTFYDDATAAAWYGLTVKSGELISGFTVGGVDTDTTTPGIAGNFFAINANTFSVGRAIEDINDPAELAYVQANGLPYGTMYDVDTGQVIPAFLIEWNGTSYDIFFNGRVTFSNVTDVPDLGSTPQEVVDAVNAGSTTTIDGGKITTGSISATQIAANAIAADKLAANALYSKVLGVIYRDLLAGAEKNLTNWQGFLITTYPVEYKANFALDASGNPVYDNLNYVRLIGEYSKTSTDVFSSTTLSPASPNYTTPLLNNLYSYASYKVNDVTRMLKSAITAQGSAYTTTVMSNGTAGFKESNQTTYYYQLKASLIINGITYNIEFGRYNSSPKYRMYVNGTLVNSQTADMTSSQNWLYNYTVQTGVQIQMRCQCLATSPVTYTWTSSVLIAANTAISFTDTDYPLLVVNSIGFTGNIPVASFIPVSRLLPLGISC